MMRVEPQGPVGLSPMQEFAMEMPTDKVHAATALMKTLANENRLTVLCHLARGEKSVTELEHLIGIRQPNLSQQLARLRAEGLVQTRRDAKTIYYSLDSVEVVMVVQLLHQLFCAEDDSTTATVSGNFHAAAE